MYRFAALGFITISMLAVKKEKKLPSTNGYC